MACIWHQSLGHTIGLAQVLLTGDTDNPVSRAAHDLVVASHRAKFDPHDLNARHLVAALLNVAEAGSKKSQTALCFALAQLGGEIAAACALERDRYSFVFPSSVRETFHRDPWGQPTPGDEEPPF